MSPEAKARYSKIRQRVYNRHAQARRRREAANLRRCLRMAMGGVCANPNNNPRCTGTRFLEFDHMQGRLWVPSKLNCWARARQYLADWSAGKLRLLCRSCNGSDGAYRGWRKRKAFHESTST